MAPSAASGDGRKSAGSLRLVALAAALCAGVPSPAAAQDVVRSAYRAAEDAYGAALSARDLARDLFDDAMNDATEARRSGDQARYGRALAVYQERAREMELRNRRLAEAASALNRARREYLESVLVELDSLIEGLSRETDEREEDLLNRRIVNLYDEADRLTRPVEIDDDPFPEINIEPGDTRSDIRAKADLLERHAARYGLLLRDIDVQIELLEQRQRHVRMARDFGANLSLFGDLRMPVGNPEEASDNAEDPTGGEELAQRLGQLNRTREFLVERRDVAAARAAEFRQRIGGAELA